MVFLNGQWMPSEQARVQVDERGFRFGDGAFETIPVHQGKPFLLSYHLERLQAGLTALYITCDAATLIAPVLETIAANQMQEGIIRLYVSRGTGSLGYLPTRQPPAPTVLIQPLPAAAAPDMPVTLWLSSWQKPSPHMLPTHAKIAQGINPMLARMESKEQGCFEALQLTPQGYVSEASSANIFWRKGNQLFTPALATGALAGVTRRWIMEVTTLPATEGEFAVAALQDADEVFLCNATLGILPVEKLQPLGYSWHSQEYARQLIENRQKSRSALST